MITLHTIATIVGARPQFIKASVLSRKIKAQSKFKEVLIHTGQHYDENMSEVFFKELEIPKPDINLEVKAELQGEQTARMLEGIEKELIKIMPDLVIVYGDTNSTLAGALAAAKLHIPLAHVEAGLRSFNRKMPEEINRIVADHLSDILFAPTQNAVDLLFKEGILKEKVYLVGDIMYDVALYYKDKAQKQSNILHNLKVKSKDYVLVTIHRAENTDNPGVLKNIFDALNLLSQDINVIIPLHPRTQKKLKEFKINIPSTPTVKIIDPVGYLDMVQLENNALMIITDSGGVQKEAYFYKIPCVTLREQTEWIELIKIGANTLINPSEPSKKIYSITVDVLNNYKKNTQNYEKIFNQNLYGEGNASDKILNILYSCLL